MHMIDEEGLTAQKIKNRKVLYQILSSIRLLGRQGLAIRGVR